MLIGKHGASLKSILTIEKLESQEKSLEIDGLECCTEKFTFSSGALLKVFKKESDTISCILEGHLANYF